MQLNEQSHSLLLKPHKHTQSLCARIYLQNAHPTKMNVETLNTFDTPNIQPEYWSAAFKKDFSTDGQRNITWIFIGIMYLNWMWNVSYMCFSRGQVNIFNGCGWVRLKLNLFILGNCRLLFFHLFCMWLLLLLLLFFSAFALCISFVGTNVHTNSLL